MMVVPAVEPPPLVLFRTWPETVPSFGAASAGTAIAHSRVAPKSAPTIGRSAPRAKDNFLPLRGWPSKRSERSERLATDGAFGSCTPRRGKCCSRSGDFSFDLLVDSPKRAALLAQRLTCLRQQVGRQL